jgi:predicted Ser/Thr protein kinase
MTPPKTTMLRQRATYRLKVAIETKLFTDLKDVVKIATSTKTPDGEPLNATRSVVPGIGIWRGSHKWPVEC